MVDIKIEVPSFGGNHCQTTALQTILKVYNLSVSEDMLLGLGGGLGFIYWHMKSMPTPFIGTRSGGRNETFIQNAVKRIGGKSVLYQTSSAEKGHEELKSLLQSGKPVYTYVDMAYLPYLALPNDAHFGSHTVVVYGLDEQTNRVYVADRSVKPFTITLEDLKKARNSKYPPFPPKNAILKIECPPSIQIQKEGCYEAINECVETMVNPPISNIGLRGLKKWADLVVEWPRQFSGLNLYGCLLTTFIYIEIGGTGGRAFRPMYARFLREASAMVDNPGLREAADLFEKSAEHWKAVAEAAFPDWWPTLRKARELMVEKNTVFEEEGAEGLQRMLEINGELDALMREGVKEMGEGDLARLLAGLREEILECLHSEENAFGVLNDVVKEVMP